jgi:hypothetical protein
VISEHEIQRRDGFRNGSLVSVPCISKLREARRKPCLFLALSYGSAALQACLALDNVPTILAAPIDKSDALPSMICRAISSAVSSAMASFVRYDEAHPRACASKRDFLRHVPLASA